MSGDPLIRELYHRGLDLVRERCRWTRLPEPASRATPGRAVPRTLQEVVATAAGRRVVLVGDFHCDGEPAEWTRLLAGILAAQGRRLVLGLEAFAARHQALLDRYVAGTICEERLQEESDWPVNWPFSPSPTRALLRLARFASIPLLALDPGAEGDVESRDRFMASRLAGSLAALPERLHIALVGEGHLAEERLPRRLAPQCAECGCGPLAILVNSESAWEAASGAGRLLAHPAVQLSPDRLALLTASPVEKLRSSLEGSGAAEQRAEERLDEEALETLLGVFAAWTGRPAPSLAGLHLLCGRPAGLERFLAARGILATDPRLLQARALDLLVLQDPALVWMHRPSLEETAAASLLLLADLPDAPVDPADPSQLHRILRMAATAELGRRLAVPRTTPRPWWAQRRRYLEGELSGAGLRRRLACLASAHRFLRSPDLGVAGHGRDPLVLARLAGELLGHRMFVGFLDGRLGLADLRAFLAATPRSPVTFTTRWHSRSRPQDHSSSASSEFA